MWNRRLSRLPWRPPSAYLHPMYQAGPSHALLPPMPMMGLFRQPPPAHLSETMYVAERTGQKLFSGQGGQLVSFIHGHHPPHISLYLVSTFGVCIYVVFRFKPCFICNNSTEYTSARQQ